MALVVTSLNGAVTQGQTRLRFTAFTNPASGGIGPKAVALVDSEFVDITDATLSPVVDVVRGTNGTGAFAHSTLAPVIYGLTSDFTQAIGTTAPAPIFTYGTSATITNPTVDATIFLTKATAAAMTLTDPAADQHNIVRIVSLTAAAHTVTYATGFYDNTTTSDVATWPATAGATLTITAANGKWRPVATADDGVTIA